MTRVEIPFDELNLNPFRLWHDSLLLTAGENQSGKFNGMTIGWGSIGVLWRKPAIIVGVRPTRFIYRLIEESKNGK